ncbi:hypothetical protein OSTOST_20107 [Ostertagia ostertagi]
MVTAQQISVERTSSSNTDQQTSRQPAARHAPSVFFIDATQQELETDTMTGTGTTPTPTARTGRLSQLTFGHTRKSSPFTKLPRKSPSNDTMKKPPTVRTPATCIEPEHLPRAPYGHHVEELQEMNASSQRQSREEDFGTLNMEIIFATKNGTTEETHVPGLRKRFGRRGTRVAD